MKTIKKCGAQGDVLFIRIDAIPSSAVRAERFDGVVAHSETGHHHKIAGAGYEYFTEPSDPFTAHLRIASDCEVVHLRPFDTHETVLLPAGTWTVRRQREWTPQGHRRVED